MKAKCRCFKYLSMICVWVILVTSLPVNALAAEDTEGEAYTEYIETGTTDAAEKTAEPALYQEAETEKPADSDSSEPAAAEDAEAVESMPSEPDAEPMPSGSDTEPIPSGADAESMPSGSDEITEADQLTETNGVAAGNEADPYGEKAERPKTLKALLENPNRYTVIMKGVTEENFERICESYLKNAELPIMYNAVMEIQDNDLTDAEKYYQHDYDWDLCWAGTASNMLWTSGYAQDAVNPETGRYFQSEDEVFDYFRKSVKDSTGNPNAALELFFAGDTIPDQIKGAERPGAAGPVIPDSEENPPEFGFVPLVTDHYLNVMESLTDTSIGLVIHGVVKGTNTYCLTHCVTGSGIVFDEKEEDPDKKYKAILLADPDNSRVTEGMDPSDPAVWDISDKEKAAKAAAAPNIYRMYPLQQKYFEHVGYRWTIPYLVGNAAVDVFIDAYAWLKDKILPDRDEKDPEEEGQNTDSGDSTDQQDGQDSQGKPEQEDDAGKSGSEDEEKETDSSDEGQETDSSDEGQETDNSDDTGRKEPGSCGDREARDGQKACAFGMSGSIASLSSAGPDGASVPACYEIRISMDPDKVLDEDHHLRQQYFDEFGLSEEYERYGTVYFETPDRAFDSEGWEGMICMREDEEADSFELTFKKRYPVSGEDIDGALCLARADGFDPADQTWNPCIEWGYSGLSLSLSAKRECPAQGCRTIADLSRSDAAQMLIENAPEIEGNRKAEGWGSRAVTEAGIAGPVYFNRYTGRFEDHKVEIEVWEIPDGETGSFTYITVLSLVPGTFTEIFQQ